MTIIIPSCSDKNLSECLDTIEWRDPAQLRNVVVMDTGLEGSQQFPAACAINQHLLGVPFNFAATINCAMELHPDGLYLILNDDAILQTPLGFTLLAAKFVPLLPT